MKLGLMQPYFFPYLGHFSLIANTDQWIVFDITQYTPATWMNRNRVLHPTQGWNYVTVPLSNSSISIKTLQARVLDPAKARETVLGKISHYKRKAPYFSAVRELVREAFCDDNDHSLVRLNTRGLAAVCRYLGMPFNYSICSELNLPLPANMQTGDWALEISTLVGATDYVNPIGGRAMFDPARFAERGIALHFLKTTEFRYDTGPYQYQPHLSILDVLMWNDPKTVMQEILPRSELLKAA